MRLIIPAIAVLVALLVLGTNSMASPAGSYVKDLEFNGNSGKIKFSVPVHAAYSMPTGSMRPTFDNDILLLTDPNDLKIGDIVVYERSGQLIVHRIIAVQSRADGLYYQLKGDNNFIPDGWVRADAVKWKVIGILY